jgi:hypothetical protein
MMEKLQTKKLDTFSEMLFRTLDHLGSDLLPLRLDKAASAYEKYPRMLVALIQRYGLEAGFQEWVTKVLRDADKYQKEDEYPELAVLHRWMAEHRDLFDDKAHLTHLKRSLYGRIYAYLYPLRLLAANYTNAHKGNADAFEESAIREKFHETLADEIDTLRKVYPDESQLEKVVSEAEDFLVRNLHYYRKWN